MVIIDSIIGLMLLFFGQRLFWLFVALSGFMVGVALTEMIIPQFQQWIQIVVALGIGLVGALLAVLAQRIAFVFGGFLAGLYMVLIVTQSFGYDDTSVFFYVFGGVAGAAAGYLFIDWAIIGLSALIGAGLIVNEISMALPLPPAMVACSFLVLLVVGISIQVRSMDGDPTDTK